MAEPILTVTESTPPSAEEDASQQLAWTEALDAPLMLLAPLLAGWVFVRHHKRARAAEAAHAQQRTQDSVASLQHSASDAEVIALDDARPAASKRSRHG